LGFAAAFGFAFEAAVALGFAAVLGFGFEAAVAFGFAAALGFVAAAARFGFAAALAAGLAFASVAGSAADGVVARLALRRVGRLRGRRERTSSESSAAGIVTAFFRTRAKAETERAKRRTTLVASPGRSAPCHAARRAGDPRVCGD
jgi:hypothetical protein